MKKFFIPILLIFAVIFVLRFVLGGPEDSWICQNGQWVKHGNPGSPMPVSPCP